MSALDGADPPGSDSPFYYLDNVHLTSVGVDIGSSTAHMMFSAVHLKRETEGLSSRFVVVDRKVLWKSEVILTPYLAGGLIDAEAVGTFVAAGYAEAGVQKADVDSGAVILTGEALKRRNARALAEAVAAGSGDFVCVTAGHHLEAMLSAHGSGSAELSASEGRAILCIDIGGGTTKFSLLEKGEVVATAAVELGGRMVQWEDDRRLVSANPALAAIGVDLARLERSGVVSEDDEAVIARAMVARLLAPVWGRAGEIEGELLLTGSFPARMAHFDAVTFAGGVAEYVYRREARSFNDLGRSVGAAVAGAVASGSMGVPVLDPGQGIRATVVGASQCSVQVSGSTVAVYGPVLLPMKNVPVVRPALDLSGGIDPGEVATEVTTAIATQASGGVVALSFSFAGPPSYARLRALADGIAGGLGAGDGPAVVMVDGDIAASLGALLSEESGMKRPVVCLDNLELKPLDFVDIGSLIRPAGVFPVVIKSLLFGPGEASPTGPPPSGAGNS